jgi:outer membrane protein assembly factor BamA
MTRHVRSLALLALLAVGGAWAVWSHAPEGEAAADVAAVRAQEIQGVALDGRNLPVAALRAVLATRARTLLDTATLEHDRVALQTALEGRGYLAARVSPAAITFATRGGAYVNFAIEQGPLFRLRKVEVVGVAEREAVVTIAAGDEAVAARIERARAALADALTHHSGKLGTVTAETHIDATDAAVDVKLVVR